MLVPVLSFFATSVGLWFVLRSGLAERLALDRPNNRSLHLVATPRIGGMVLMPAFLLVWFLLPARDILFASLIAVLALFSYFDDRSDLPVGVRLVLHLAAGTIFVLMKLHLHGPAIAAAILWIGWCTNLYNFMDGADGLAGGMALFGFSLCGLALVGAGEYGLSGVCFAIAAAAAGFLLFNFPPAKTFMGDAGSISLGFLMGTMGLLGRDIQAWPLWYPVLVFSSFIVDATVTLSKRAWRGERVWQAHHDHYYQRLVRMGWSHRRVALYEYALMTGCGVSALILLRCGKEIQYAGLAVLAIIYVVLMIKIDSCWKTFSATPR